MLIFDSEISQFQCRPWSERFWHAGLPWLALGSRYWEFVSRWIQWRNCELRAFLRHEWTRFRVFSVCGAFPVAKKGRGVIWWELWSRYPSYNPQGQPQAENGICPNKIQFGLQQNPIWTQQNPIWTQQKIIWTQQKINWTQQKWISWKTI